MSDPSTHNSEFSKASNSQLFVIACISLFASISFALIPNWGRSTYYDYGWLVPPLVAFFLHRRWSELPVNFNHSKCIIAILAITLTFFIFLRWVEHLDPLWRLPLWLHAATFLLALHSLLAAKKGYAGSVKCLPASLLILTAVPLPSLIENPLIYKLTETVVNLGHSTLLFMGYGVERLANLFIANGCMLDVAEGCSGVRSFQASLMASLCLGEFTRLSIFRRLFLVCLSLTFAIIANAGRIVGLGYAAYHGGQPRIDSLHDPLGSAVLISVFASLSLSAFLLMRTSPSFFQNAAPKPA